VVDGRVPLPLSTHLVVNQVDALMLVVNNPGINIAGNGTLLGRFTLGTISHRIIAGVGVGGNCFAASAVIMRSNESRIGEVGLSSQ
jgi:hypothetical protein